MFIDKKSKIYVAGHRGMVGSALVRELTKEGYTNLITRSSKELDLCNQNATKKFFKKERPNYVFMAAAKVGGIQANIQNPVAFLQENLQIQNNIIAASFEFKVKKFVFIGSSCIYPKKSSQPMKEEYLLNGELEPTNEGYALAKIAGLKLCEYYSRQHGWNAISLMPCNMYGINDHFDLKNSHVFSALIKKIVDAKESNDPFVSLWGTGIARREFLNVDDFAEMAVKLFETYNQSEFINIGCGNDISIYDLAHLIKQKVGFAGVITWDNSKPNGMLLKCLDISKIKKLGLSPKISIEEGIEQMINLYKNHQI